MKIYLVGGAVRDTLLGLPIHDRDWVVVGATAQQLLQQGYQTVGKDFPVFLHPQTQEEYALARTERKSGQGYTGFSCYAGEDVTLEQDLLRRDLTINAMALSTDGQLFDPFQGKRDLEQRILRHVSEAFREDPLRVLRIARFAARFDYLGFTIAPETLQLMQHIAQSGELHTLTAERVWKETEKALATQSPHIYFQVLRDCQALAILFPELNNLFGVPAPVQWHPEIDSGIHSLLSLNIATQLTHDIGVRFSALFHDVGKALTPVAILPHHPNHGVLGVPIIKALCERLHLPNQIRDLVLSAVEFHDELHCIKRLSPERLLTIFNRIDVWRKPERLHQILQVCEADMRGRFGYENQHYPAYQEVMTAFTLCHSVNIQEIIAEGLTGVAIRNELNRRRLALLTNWLTQCL